MSAATSEPEWLAFPSAGALRVGYQPDRFPAVEPQHPGRNRFDDPRGDYSVLYAGTELSTCVAEILVDFNHSRYVQDVGELLKAVEDTDEPPYDPDSVLRIAVEKCLAVQLVVRIDVVAGKFINVGSDTVLDRHNVMPSIKKALRLSGLGSDVSDVRLDQGTVWLNGERGRIITQALSRSVYDTYPDCPGTRYYSRVGADGECWAIFDRTESTVVFPSLGHLEPLNAHDREAVQVAAKRFELPLPPIWL